MPKVTQTSDNIGIQILNLFGLDDTNQVRRAVITLEVGEVVMIDIERYAEVNVNNETGELVIPIELKKYKLSVELVEDT